MRNDRLRRSSWRDIGLARLVALVSAGSTRRRRRRRPLASDNFRHKRGRATEFGDEIGGVQCSCLHERSNLDSSYSPMAPFGVCRIHVGGVCWRSLAHCTFKSRARNWTATAATTTTTTTTTTRRTLARARALLYVNAGHLDRRASQLRGSAQIHSLRAARCLLQFLRAPPTRADERAARVSTSFPLGTSSRLHNADGHSAAAAAAPVPIGQNRERRRRE